MCAYILDCVHASVRLWVILCECDLYFLACAYFCVAASVLDMYFLPWCIVHEDMSCLLMQVSPTENAAQRWANVTLKLRIGSNVTLDLRIGANATPSLPIGANAAVSLAGRSRGHLVNAALHKRSLYCRISWDLFLSFDLCVGVKLLGSILFRFEISDWCFVQLYTRWCSDLPWKEHLRRKAVTFQSCLCLLVS